MISNRWQLPPPATGVLCPVDLGGALFCVAKGVQRGEIIGGSEVVKKVVLLSFLLTGCDSGSERAEAMANIAKTCPGEVTIIATSKPFNTGVSITCHYGPGDEYAHLFSE